VYKTGVWIIYSEDATEIKYVFPWPMYSKMEMENVEMGSLLYLLYAQLACACSNCCNVGNKSYFF
jgi:hypothetical protein